MPCFSISTLLTALASCVAVFSSLLGLYLLDAKSIQPKIYSGIVEHSLEGSEHAGNVESKQVPDTGLRVEQVTDEPCLVRYGSRFTMGVLQSAILYCDR